MNTVENTIELTIVICIYNMQREAPRTIQSALPPYQKNTRNTNYEVLVVDNGSNQELPTSFVEKLPPQVRIIKYEPKKPSPVFAMNWAIKNHARGEHIMICIDGARILSDKLVAQGLAVLRQIPNAFVYSLAWHLGPDTQMVSTQHGYNQEVEDNLLKEIDWYHNPGKLFSISSFAGSSRNGFFHPIAESNAFTLPKTKFLELGGYCEKFELPGGGLANLELFSRCVSTDKLVNVCLLSEGTFHQVHGGIATSNSMKKSLMWEEYQDIFGIKYKIPEYDTLYFGAIRPSCIPFHKTSLEKL